MSGPVYSHNGGDFLSTSNASEHIRRFTDHLCDFDSLSVSLVVLKL